MAAQHEEMALELAFLEEDFLRIKKQFEESDGINPEEQRQLDKLQRTIEQINNQLNRLGIKKDPKGKKELKLLFKKLVTLIKQLDSLPDTKQV